ncbi:DUF2125 domain-containing protein [Devosia sp. WQ 349]|uniref:DUF2125 domain-containing protein n=1 Tax=Devosia sp. WQ 349K1 TaxID=2800329 RepID=UPI00190327F8|nr:DUF2125 domain-containing protein [Devosia sp. WQ 349K1]MBK1795374.1 DUF2125 domain-containing protein [Devosia sp. WQ 349K1]
MKKRIIILGSVVLLVLLAWTGVWFYISGQLREQIGLLAYNDGETAPQLVCETLDITGFPSSFAIDCRNASVVTGDVLTKIPAVRATAFVYSPTNARVSALGPATISDAFTGSEQSLAWSGLEASIRLKDWRIGRISLIADDLVWADQLFGDRTIATSSKAELHLLDIPEAHNTETKRASVATYLRFADIEAPGFNVTQTNAELEAELSALPDDLRKLGAVPFLPDWQQAGGTLNLVGLRASDPQGDLNATGELTLDAAGYPTGSITIDSEGVAQRLGVMLEEPVRTLVLGVPGENGRHTNVLTFANGGMSAGLVPVAAIPPLF